MPGMPQEPPAHVIALEGVLDVPAAAKLRDTVLAFDVGDRIVIDCHEVRDLQDSALAFLVWSLSSCGRRVDLRGLGEHHLRLLRYLGVEQTDTGDGEDARIA